MSKFSFILSIYALVAFSWMLPARADVYVSLAKEKQIALFRIDVDSGKLELKARFDVAGQPGAMSFDRTGKRLYVAMKSKGGIASYDIAEDGTPRLINLVQIDGSAGYVAVHPSGNFLLCSYYSEGMFSIHNILEDGSLGEEPVEVRKTDERAHAIVTDPSGEFFFVPHTRPNSIFQFCFDVESGAVIGNDPPVLQRKAESGPRHLWFHPTGPFAFSSDEQGKAITSYGVTNTGTLIVQETIPSFPKGYLEKGSTADIEVHPSGRFVYIANRGVNTIAGYGIDPNNGRLKFLQQSEVEPVPRSFNISPDGNHLVAAGQQSGNLVAFQIDEQGMLTETDRISSGGSPWWVVFRP